MEKSIDVAPYRFNYCTLGQSNNPPLLFLHGFMGNCHEFAQIMAVLSNQFYCLAIDLPGHGKTQTADHNQHYTMQQTAEGLIRFLKALDIKCCCLLGYSMGGRIALYLTLHFPSYFSQTILESTSPGLKTHVERVKRIERDLKLAQELETKDFAEFLTRWYRQPLFATLSKHPAFEQLLNDRLQNCPLGLAKSLRNLSTGHQPSLWQKLEQNSVPLLLLVGQLDAKFIGINQEMTRVCKAAKLEIVDQAGHNIHFEQSNILIEKIRSFLATHLLQ